MSHNKIIGNYGEDLAVNFLKKKGYKIIGRNVQMRHKELDIIAKIKDIVVFVEVKTNTSKHILAEDNMTKRKIKNLKTAISDYIHRNNLSTKIIRLDLISIDIVQDQNITNIKHFLASFLQILNL